MYEKAFKKIFWGYLFTVINFRISGIDILPNIIGYIIILLGLKVLTNENEYFKKALNYNYGMIIISIPEIYKAPSKGVVLGIERPGLMNIILGIVGLIIVIYFMYNIFMGIKGLCKEKNILILQNNPEDLWSFYWKLLIAIFFAIPIAFIPVIGIIYFIIIAIASIVLNVRILKLFWEISDRFNIDRAIN